MKFIRNILIESVFVFGAIYGWQIVKSLITGNVNPTLIGVIISAVIGYYLANKVIKKIDN